MGASFATVSSIDAQLPVLAVILAGGSGTRLWPLARAANPKQFLPLLGGKSPFRLTYDRVVPLVGRSNVVVVTGRPHVPRVRQETPKVPRGRIIVEGIGRNTAASVALAARWILSHRGDAIMIVLPADHWVRPHAAFRAALRRGIEAARRTDGLVTIGIRPTSPDEGFGYILHSDEVVAPGVRRVRKFVEKPSVTLARRIIRRGHCLWNSGVFIWRSSAILAELRRYRPDVLAPVDDWARRARPGPWSVGAATLRRTPAVPIDRAVLERSDNVLVVPGTFRWTDLGTWGALGDRLLRDRKGNAGIGRILAVGSARCLGINQGGLSVFVGVEDIVAVRSEDTLLVCRLDRAQKVRDVVDRLRGRLGRYR